MSELAILPEQLVDVRTGELRPATPENAADILRVVRDLRRQMLDVVKDCEAVLLEESRRQGTKTLHLPSGDAVITGGSEVEWDLDALEALRELGLPEGRFRELVVETISYKVDQRVAKQLSAANEAYARVIDAARSIAPARWRVSIK